MRRMRGFALGVFLLLLPVLTLMAWTFLKVGSGCRAEAVVAERRVRGLQAAEAGIRYYLATGRTDGFELNDCDVAFTTSNTTIVSTAVIHHSRERCAVTLDISAGFVSGRRTNEGNFEE